MAARELPPAARVVAERLARLRAVYVPETEEETRRRLAPPPAPVEAFPRAVARRLAELRALDALTRHLHGRRPRRNTPDGGR